METKGKHDMLDQRKPSEVPTFDLVPLTLVLRPTRSNSMGSPYIGIPSLTRTPNGLRLGRPTAEA